jgi:flagellar hook-basal body complex protein FliE
VSDVAIGEVLAQMRAMAAAARGEEAGNAGGAAGEAAFGELMKASIDEVNRAMQDSKQLAERFESGDPEVSLTELMVTAQRANIEFQALTEVRNKLLTAYQEIMNMQV